MKKTLTKFLRSTVIGAATSLFVFMINMMFVGHGVYFAKEEIAFFFGAWFYCLLKD